MKRKLNHPAKQSPKKNKLETDAQRKNQRLQLACKNNEADMVKLLLSDTQVNPRDNKDYCINIASQNNFTEILSLLFNDDRIGAQYFHSVLLSNNLRQIKLYLDYKDNISTIIFLLHQRVSSNKNPALNTLLLMHDTIDLNEMFLYIRADPNPEYISLRKQIFEHDRFNINSLIVYCYHQGTFEIPNYHGLKQELFAHPKLDFSKVFEKKLAHNPAGNLESLFMDLYNEKLLSFNTIQNQNLVKEPLNIYNLILECFTKGFTKIENEPLVTYLINDKKINFSYLIQIFTKNDVSVETLFIQLYQNKMLSLEHIVNQAILSQPTLELTLLVRDFFRTRVLVKDIKFREHLLGHPRLHDYNNKDVLNIYDLFKYFSKNKLEKSEDKFDSISQLELLVPYVQEALQQNKEILEDYYDWIDSEEDISRKKQLIDVLIRPIYEKTRFFPQAPINSKLHLPELWKMIANNMIHHTLGTVPKDHDLTIKPK